MGLDRFCFQSFQVASLGKPLSNHETKAKTLPSAPVLAKAWCPYNLRPPRGCSMGTTRQDSLDACCMLLENAQPLRALDAVHSANWQAGFIQVAINFLSDVDAA